ncbi:MAG: DNA-processing protein DprA [Clostridia bacterium]|nr:DNA-processing protein DprA [Clostridia bacterium]
MALNIEYRKYFAALHWACTGTRKLERLLLRFTSPMEAWKATKQHLSQIPGWDRDDVEAFTVRRDSQDVQRHWEYLESAGIKMILRPDQAYPENLSYIYDPPQVLYVKGSTTAFKREAVAIVGTRKASHYGKLVAGGLAEDLAGRGILVVSGLARGIDSAAHKGALSSGSTVAVLGCGLDVVYPRENRKLLAEVIDRGAVISEYPLGTPPNAWNFPARNRIISGLSLGVVVVEAEEKSGSLITVDCALDQGREVFAVPGNIYASTSKGPHKLVKQGAKLVTCTEDILEELALDTLFPRVAQPSFPGCTGLTPEEDKVLQLLEVEPMPVDVLAAKSGLVPGYLLSILTFLELKGLVKQLPGQNFLRVGTF